MTRDKKRIPRGAAGIGAHGERRATFEGARSLLIRALAQRQLSQQRRPGFHVAPRKHFPSRRSRDKNSQEAGKSQESETEASPGSYRSASCPVSCNASNRF